MLPPQPRPTGRVDGSGLSCERVSNPWLSRLPLVFSVCRVKQVTCKATEYETSPPTSTRPRGALLHHWPTDAVPVAVLTTHLSSLPTPVQSARQSPLATLLRSTRQQPQQQRGASTRGMAWAAPGGQGCGSWLMMSLPLHQRPQVCRTHDLQAGLHLREQGPHIDQVSAVVPSPPSLFFLVQTTQWTCADANQALIVPPVFSQQPRVLCRLHLPQGTAGAMGAVFVVSVSYLDADNADTAVTINLPLLNLSTQEVQAPTLTSDRACAEPNVRPCGLWRCGCSRRLIPLPSHLLTPFLL